MDYVLTTVEWAVTYPVSPDAPIGRIRLEDGLYRAWLHEEDLDVYPTGDEAAEAIWRRFLEASESRHAHASVMHGGADRHLRPGLAAQPSLNSRGS